MTTNKPRYDDIRLMSNTASSNTAQSVHRTLNLPQVERIPSPHR
jgi:hypothetical protein